MKVIFLQNVKNVGIVGDIKNVSDGYARNFLLPKKLAEIATADAIRKCEESKKEKILEEKKEQKKARELAEYLSEAKIVVRAKEKNGKLFGSIGAKEIVQELKKQNLNIEEKAIKISQPIKEVGERDVVIELDFGIEATIKVKVEAE